LLSADARGDLVRLILDGLQNENRRVRAEAAFELAQIEQLEKVIREPDVQVMLATLNDLNFPDEGRASLTRVLARFPTVRSQLVDTLIRLLQSANCGPAFQLAASSILTQSHTDRSFYVLKKMAKSDHHLVRAQALTALGLTGIVEADEFIELIAESHPDPGTRDVAYQVLNNSVGDHARGSISQ
jgi:HEAT repeat protein